MKLNFHQLLTVAVFFGTVNCTGKDDLKKKLEDGLKELAVPHDAKDPSALSPLRQKMIVALQYPKCFIDKKFVIDDVDLKCKDDNAHEFYRLNFKDVNNIVSFSSYCKTNTDLSKLTDEDLKNEILEQYNQKRDYLKAIIKNIPIVKDYDGVLTDGFDLIIQSHINNYVAESLVYDGKRLTFSALHKAVESILNAHEVDRKAQDAVNGAIAMISNDKTKWVEIKNIKTDMVIKPSEPRKDEKKAGDVVEEKPKNIINVALKASDKSTSSPTNLAYFLVASLLLSTLLLGFKAYTTKPAKEEEEEDEE